MRVMLKIRRNDDVNILCLDLQFIFKIFTWSVGIDTYLQSARVLTSP